MSRHTRTRQITLATASVAALSVVFAGPAFASLWARTGSAAGTGKAHSVGAATVVTVPSSTVTNGTVAVSWSGATGPSGATLMYFVERMVGASATPACGSTLAAPISGSSCNDTSVPDGSYKYRVTTRLGDNWQATSSQSATVTVTAAVTVTVGTPDLTAASDSGSSNTDNLTNVTTPTFTVAATTGASVQLFDNGVATGSAVTSSGGSATLTSGTLTGGTGTAHTITATATLSATTVTSGGLVVTVDTSAPTVGAITVDTNGSNANGKGLSGTASTATSHPGSLATVTVGVAGVTGAGCSVTPTTASVNQSTGAWSGPVVSLNRGFSCTATVTQLDSAGNTGSNTATVTRS
jgi:hypothetical protein